MKHLVYISSILLFLSQGAFSASDHSCNCAKSGNYKDCSIFNAKQCIIDGDPVAALNIINNAKVKVDIETFNMISDDNGCGVVNMLAYYPTLGTDGKTPVSTPDKKQIKAIEQILTKISEAFVASSKTTAQKSTFAKGAYDSYWEFRKSATNHNCQNKTLHQAEYLKPAEQAIAAKNVDFIAALSNLKEKGVKLLFTKAKVNNFACESASGGTPYTYVVAAPTAQDFMMLDDYLPVGPKQCLGSVKGLLASENPYRNISVLFMSDVFGDSYAFGPKEKVNAGRKGAVRGILKDSYKKWEDLPASVQTMTEMFAKLTAPSSTDRATKSIEQAYEGGAAVFASYYNGSCPDEKLRIQFPLVPDDLADLIKDRYSKDAAAAATSCQI